MLCAFHKVHKAQCRETKRAQRHAESVQMAAKKEELRKKQADELMGLYKNPP